jgi:hypothetical protein
VETVLEHYIAAALWSSTDESSEAGGEPLDKNYTADDLAPEAREQMLADVVAFLQGCWGDTWEEFSIDLTGIEPEQIGHDFWLTRNHHGAGFWDRGLGEAGDKLTTFAHTFGDCHLYVEDDGLLYI